MSKDPQEDLIDFIDDDLNLPNLDIKKCVSTPPPGFVIC